MPRLLVALDIGPKVARMAALTVVSKKQYSLHALEAEPILPEEGPAAAVDRLLGRIEGPVDSVVGVFSLQNASIRTLKLPFSDRKKIDQVLPFELDGVFPFDADESVFNYVQVAKGPDGSELLVGAARRELVASRLELYRECGHEPRNLLVDGFALGGAADPASIPDLFGDEAERAGAYLHVGYDETLLLIERPDGYRFARAFRSGRRELLSRAARVGGKDVTELEAALATGAASGEFAAVFAPLVRDIDATLRSMDKTVGIRPSRVLVSGEAARWPGFTDAMGQAIGMPAETLAWDETAAGDTDGVLGDYAPLVGAAVQSVQGEGLDLRSGEFIYTRAIQLVKGKLIVSGSFALALILLLIFSNVFAYFGKTSEIDRMQDEIETLFHEAMPNDPIVDPVVQMRTYVSGLRQQVTGSGATGIVDMMKGMSEAIPGDLAFKINEFHKDTGGVRLKATTDSYENIETIKNAITKVPGMENVRVSDSKTTTAGVVFELALEGADERAR